MTKINQSAKKTLAEFKWTEVENAGVMITALNSDDSFLVWLFNWFGDGKLQVPSPRKILHQHLC